MMLKSQTTLIYSLNKFLLMVMFICSTFLLLFASKEVVFLEFLIVSFSNWSMSFVFMFDEMSNLFLLSVSLISFSVMNFSKSYMSNDKNFIRFHYLLMSFILSMYFLILSPNLVSILLGWDGLGLSSYLLVIYYGSSKAYNSGMVTALTNRLGDALILLSIGYIFMFGGWNIYFYNGEKMNFWLLLVLILAASTKSAQIPFSAWLPAAMAAPTPVSSLVHSSTLVTAGVYLLIRHSNWFFMNNISYYMLIMGSFTMIMASISALFETDLKKMVALSTLSQLGVMFMALSLGGYMLSYFHLLTHAFFKALLFLCTGAIIHSSKDYQDLRMTGNSISVLPTINSFILISSFSLMGLPFMSAFFSKEMILEFILLNNNNFMIYFLMVLGVGLTAMYSARFILMVFSFWNLNDLLTFKSEEDPFILKSMLILMIPASLSGTWLVLYLFNSLKLYESMIFMKILILILIFLMPIWILTKKLDFVNWNLSLWSSSSMWLLPFITTQIFCNNSLKTSWFTFKILDRGNLVVNNQFLKSINFLFKTTISIKLLYKILSLMTLWAVLIFMIYMCKL